MPLSSNIELLTQILPEWNKTTLTTTVYHEMFEQNLTSYNTTDFGASFRVCSMEEDLNKVKGTTIKVLSHAGQLYSTAGWL